MIKELKLRWGSSQSQAPLSFEPGHMTLFVGPNNSGKSLALKEIHATVTDASLMSRGIVSGIDLKPVGEKHLRRWFTVDSEGQFVFHSPGTGRGAGGSRLEQYLESLQQSIEGGDQANLNALLHPVYSYRTVILDGSTRLKMLEESVMGNLLSHPETLLQVLFRDNAARAKLRTLIHEAFGYYFIVDQVTRSGRLGVRFSKVEPKVEEKLVEAESIGFITSATPISEFSDGIKAFAGITAAILSTPHIVILIDEPEAFLHPPLIRRLGKTLAETASEREGNVFAATHSADFLMGCIQSRTSIDVVRLTYTEGVATARLLSAKRLQELMRDPFLRSTGVLSALFHNGAVVSEADTDRAFYQEVNERLLDEKIEGVADSLFLNANGKDSIGRIVQPLREMGLPAAIIVDLDIIDKGFTNLVRAAFIPPALEGSLKLLKDQLHNSFVALGKAPKKVGIDVLSKDDKESGKALLNSLGEYGVFVVPVGEVENWLPNLGVKHHGTYWLSQVFEKMGNNPNDAHYIKPAEGDVWDFMKKVAAWIDNPNRKGIPE